jgi:hypothetical protein
MRTKIFSIFIAVAMLLLASCHNELDLQPVDRVSSEQLFSDIAGVKTVLATLYNECPIEDFNYQPDRTMNLTGTGDNSDGGWNIGSHTDEMVISSNAGGNVGPTNDQYWEYNANGHVPAWTGIRYVNGFFSNIKALKGKTLDVNTYNRLWSEAHFIRAYMYFALVKRYGGVPLIKDVQTIGGDNSQLYIPRSTEKETWNFVLAECDSAVMNLPATVTSQDGTYRATKWAAYALKSRAALHAASIAKFWNNAAVTGPAVDAKLVGGMTITDANGYYLQCINASKEIILNSGKTLYKPTPANKAEAIANLQTIFETPASADVEVIFKRGYVDGVATQAQGHQMDIYGYPAQLQQPNIYNFGRMGVTLDLVNAFENYADDGKGASGVLQTRTDGVENVYIDDPKKVDVKLPFKYYDSQLDIFADKDARLFAHVILPGSTFKNVLINMQGGLIKPDGTTVIFSAGSATGLDGKTYYAYGSPAALGFSAFGSLGGGLSANSSSTGFVIKKFLQEKTTPTPSRWGGSTQDWIDFRLAEIYLNYAEAAIESGQGDAALAETYLNAIRKRAAHIDNIPATITNIMKERFVEFAFEGKHFWDLMRRREMHTTFNVTKRKSLVPVLDLRQNTPKYIFIRANNFYDVTDGGKTFSTNSYYRSIPGVSSNKLIQNPGF